MSPACFYLHRFTNNTTVQQWFLHSVPDGCWSMSNKAIKNKQKPESALWKHRCQHIPTENTKQSTCLSSESARTAHEGVVSQACVCYGNMTHSRG